MYRKKGDGEAAENGVARIIHRRDATAQLSGHQWTVLHDYTVVELFCRLTPPAAGLP